MRRHGSITERPHGDFTTGAYRAITTTLVMFFLVTDPARDGGLSTRVPSAIAGTALVLAWAVALSVVIRVVSGTPATRGQWLRRFSAGAVLLIPGALYLTRPFPADGWDFETCGTLLDGRRHFGAPPADFLAACDIAGRDRLVRMAIWVGVALVVAALYGWSLRRAAPAR
jgi:multisubunit Na+/H+ antiporter MnhB subunit